MLQDYGPDDFILVHGIADKKRIVEIFDYVGSPDRASLLNQLLDLIKVA